jgi:branched-chain amino acid transport system ATP-binding protein
MGSAILEIRDLNKAFGGLQAAKNINLQVRKGELSSIIGPNGAGKTTLFNLITGSVLPDSGTILFGGEAITGNRTFDVVKAGIGMTFQKANIFPRLTVYQNVELSVVSRRKKTMNLLSSIFEDREIEKEVMGILQSVNMTDKKDLYSGSLSHGDQKLLDIAIALGLRPKLLLVDEPTAGMSPGERRETVNLLKRLWEDMAMTLVFIEHDMDIVFSISERIRVLHHGELIAEGSPEEIANNNEVIEAYLGEEICY